MEPCSFYWDRNTAASRSACSRHGDRHPAECADELRKELEAALLQVEEANRKGEELCHGYGSLLIGIHRAMEKIEPLTEISEGTHEAFRILSELTKLPAPKSETESLKRQVREMKEAIRFLVEDRERRANHPDPLHRLGLDTDTLLKLESFIDKRKCAAKRDWKECELDADHAGNHQCGGMSERTTFEWGA